MEDLREDLEQETEENLPEAQELDAEEIERDDDADDESDELDGFEFDEDGNIIVGGDDEDEENAKAEEQEYAEGEEGEEGDGHAVESDGEPLGKSAPVNENRTEKSDTEELEAMRVAVKDMLHKLGEDNVGDDEILERVMKVAAESADMSLDDYKKQIEDKKIVEAARRAKQNSEAESVMSADLAVLKASYTEMKGVDHLSKMPNFKRFCELRAGGASAEEAYLATNGKAVRANMAKNVQKSSLAGTKEHLRASGGKASATSTSGISKRELESLREQFNGLSDKEIIGLYRRAQK